MAANVPDYAITFSPYDGGLRAHVTGEASLAATVAYWREIADEARRTGASSLLLIDDMGGEALGESDWLQLVTALRDEGLDKLRIAHVKPAGLQQVEFCEIYARDAGIEARVFENETLAGVWLRYGGP